MKIPLSRVLVSLFRRSIEPLLQRVRRRCKNLLPRYIHKRSRMSTFPSRNHPEMTLVSDCHPIPFSVLVVNIKGGSSLTDVFCNYDLVPPHHTHYRHGRPLRESIL